MILTLNNFKSYSGNHVFPLESTPFVAIVGPNGSGKSNLLDALCFVIGLDTRQLRCQSFSELITKNANSMFVELKVNNTTTFKRTDQQTFLNGKSVSFKEYVDAWKTLNILPNGKNSIVLQGDIEKLSQANPQQLSDLVETLGNYTDLDAYLNLETKLEEAEQSMLKLNSNSRKALAAKDEHLKLSEAKAKLEDLKLSLRKSIKRKNCLLEREKTSVLNLIRKEIRSDKLQVNNCQQGLELAENDAKKLRTEFARKRRHLQTARNSEQELKNSVQNLEAQIEPLNKRQTALLTEIRLVKPELEFNELNLKTSVDEIQKVKEMIQLLQREFSRDQTHTDNNADPVIKEKYLKFDTDFITNTALTQDELKFKQKQFDKAKQNLDLKLRQQEDLQSELKTINQKHQTLKQRVNHLESLVEERGNQQKQRRLELNSLAEELVQLNVDQQECTTKLKDLSVKIKEANGNKQQLLQRHKLLDSVDRLRRAFPNVYDIVGNLIEPIEPRFQVAIEKGFGAFNLDTILVEDVETAVKCIELAKKDRLGRLHFMVLENLKPRDFTQHRAQLARFSGTRLLSDCCSFDAKYRNAVHQLLNDSVFVESFDQGNLLRSNGLKMRFVSSSGQVISKSNIVSTSSKQSLVSHRNLALMQRKEHNLNEKLKQFKQRRLELTDSELRLNNQISRCDKMVAGALNELEIANEQVASSTKSVNNHLNQIELIDDEVTKLVENLDSVEADVQIVKDALNLEREQFFKPFIAEVGGSLQSWDQIFLNGAQRLYELRRQGQRLNDRLQIAGEKRASVQSLVSKQQERLKTLESALQEVEKQLEVVNLELQTQQNKFQQAKARLVAARNEAEEKSDEVGMAESAVDNARVLLEQSLRSFNKHKEELQDKKDLNPNEDGKLDDDSEFEDEEMAELSDDSSSEDDRGVKRKRQTLSIDRLEARISNLKAEIEVLSSLVNKNDDDMSSQTSVHASQFYDGLEQQAQKLRSEQDVAFKKFEKLRQERSVKFMAVFDELQSALKSTFTELIGENTHAQLTVIDTDKPFNGLEFTVMLPGKQFTPVAQLSGGERSMATLALLFACQQLRPAPFIVLDEVDAALDFANVQNLSKYLLQHCHETQYLTVSLQQRLFQTASHLVGVYKPKKATEVITMQAQESV